MSYRNAKKLHNGDEIILKETGEVLTVISAYKPKPMNMINKKNIFIECNDGNTYHHTNVR